MSTGEGRGSLKIFFGYAAGVGKTYAMLKAAHTAEHHGTEVLAGYIEPHTRPETLELLKGLEQLPPKKVYHGDMVLKEFDLDAALRIRPQLILVDELAHTNAPGSRHLKRYQDVEELLRAGIDVYTTVNVQHIESLNDIVAEITGVQVRERIPDSVFDRAGQVEIVDIEPAELLERLKSGRIYKKPQAQRAMENFFTLSNLTALREIALRRCADRVSSLSSAGRAGEHPGEDHILVCLSSSPSNEKIIRTAARMAGAFKGIFTALFVETPDFPSMSRENMDRLRSNIRLAEQLGAKIETVYGSDIPYQIAEFARLSGVTKLVLGRSAGSRRHFFAAQSLTDRLIAADPGMDIHIIPDTASSKPYRSLKRRKIRFSAGDLMKSLLILLISSCIGGLFDYLGFEEANIITVYVLGVLVTSVVTGDRIYSLCSSVVSVLIFNFLFTEPKFSLNAYDSGYPVTFFIMFVSALITSSLAEKLKSHAKQSALAAYRSKILFDVNQSLQQAESSDDIINTTALHLTELLHRDIVIYPAREGRLLKAKIFFCEDSDKAQENYINEREKAVAMWVFKNNKQAGATTQTLSGACMLYFAIRVNRKVCGVAGIAAEGEALDSSEKSMTLSILGECALALENQHN